jgi:sugar lactone lactonase YvrE
MPGRVGSLALGQGGALVLALEQEFVRFEPTTGAITALAPLPVKLPAHRLNDGRCDPAGRFLAGTMNMARDGATGTLWSLDAAGSVRAVAEGVTVANGLAFSPDGGTAYWADSPRELVWAFDYDTAAGTLRNRRVFIEPGAAAGRPDGAAVDSDGCYWSARWLGGRVVRFTPEGKVDLEIALPVARVTMCCFGDADLRTLFVTTAWEGADEAERAREPRAGGLFALRVAVAGLPEPRFAG